MSVDFNMVATEEGEFVELQGSGEEATFSQASSTKCSRWDAKGIGELIAAQRAAAGSQIAAPRLKRTPYETGRSSPASPGRTAVISPICCWKKVTKFTASSAGRAPSTPSRIDHLYQDPHINGVRLFLHYGDLTDSVNLVKLLYELKPDEIYHLGAQSHVRVSFDIPEYTSDVTGVGTIRILEAMRETGIRPQFYQASSSEMFGKVQEVPQTETTPFWPRSPYGVAKVFAYWATVNYRESYGPSREQRHPVQPRKSAARRNVRDAEDHARRGGD